MKPTIAAALSSWLLMAPPIGGGYSLTFDAATPISRWLVVNSYESPDECEFARLGRVANAMRDLDCVLNKPSPGLGSCGTHRRGEIRRGRLHHLLIWAYLWECASSDDPRLHGD